MTTWKEYMEHQHRVAEQAAVPTLGQLVEMKEKRVTTTKMTRKERVLKCLRPRRWVAGYEITKPTIGGSEGLRRLRELRSEGYEIKSRRIPGSQAFEYRLIKTP